LLDSPISLCFFPDFESLTFRPFCCWLPSTWPERIPIVTAIFSSPKRKGSLGGAYKVLPFFFLGHQNSTSIPFAPLPFPFPSLSGTRGFGVSSSRRRFPPEASPVCGPALVSDARLVNVLSDIFPTGRKPDCHSHSVLIPLDSTSTTPHSGPFRFCEDLPPAPTWPFAFSSFLAARRSVLRSD